MDMETVARHGKGVHVGPRGLTPHGLRARHLASPCCCQAHVVPTIESRSESFHSARCNEV